MCVKISFGEKSERERERKTEREDFLATLLRDNLDFVLLAERKLFSLVVVSVS